ncbi:MAG: TIGR00289 family protein [Euryarchaeota archaeon]|nr:TIGR00289 family protein [Euryarchaeota archaeon]
MKVAVLSSGGKDSSAAIWWAQCQGWDVTHLVTMLVQGGDSWMFQVPGTHMVKAQAEACDVDWLPIETLGSPEEEISDLERGIENLDIDGIVSGALRSDYQKTRLERMSQRLGIKSFTPLWHQSSKSHMKGLVENGFEIMISGVSSEGLDKSWLGKVLCEKSLIELENLSLKYRFNFDGEGGEYETLIVNGPHMRYGLDLNFNIHWDGVRGHLDFI